MNHITFILMHLICEKIFSSVNLRILFPVYQSILIVLLQYIVGKKSCTYVVFVVIIKLIYYKAKVFICYFIDQRPSNSKKFVCCHFIETYKNSNNQYYLSIYCHWLLLSNQYCWCTKDAGQNNCRRHRDAFLLN